MVAAICPAIFAIYAGLRQLPADELMVFPRNLHLERTLPAASSPINYLTTLGLLTATFLIYGAFRKGKAQPIRIFGAAWFGLAYLPVSNLFPLNATVAEHWLYLPSVGFRPDPLRPESRAKLRRS
jgi:hypothetical protein